MNILQIKLFLNTVNLHSIHKASEHCNISPQGASKALLLLEQELGIALLKRSNRESLPTKDGEALYPKFQILSDTYDAIVSYAASTASSYAGKLTIAAIPRFIDAHLGYILAELYEEQPKINIHIKSLTQSFVYQELTDTTSDAQFGIVAIVDLDNIQEALDRHLEQKGLAFVPFYTCEMYACALWQIIRQLGDKVDRQAEHAFPIIAYKYDSFFVDPALQYDNYAFQINSISSQLQLINTRQAIGSFSLDEYNMFFDPKKHGYLAYEPPIMQTYGFVYQKNKILSPLECFVQEFIRSELQKSAHER